MKFESCADYSKYHLSYHVVNNIHVRPQKVTFWHLIWSGLSNLKWNSNFNNMQEAAYYCLKIYEMHLRQLHLNILDEHRQALQPSWQLYEKVLFGGETSLHFSKCFLGFRSIQNQEEKHQSPIQRYLSMPLQILQYHRPCQENLFQVNILLQLVLEELCSQWITARASFIRNDRSTVMVPLIIYYSSYESKVTMRL